MAKAPSAKKPVAKKPVAKKPAPKAKPKPVEKPKGKAQDFPIDMVKFEPALQPRTGDASTPVGGLYADHVTDLRAAIKAGKPLPRVQIWIVPGRGNLVTDGHHTTEAYRQEGKKTVPAEVHEGTWLDAVKASTSANDHSAAPKKYTGEEKRRAVSNLLLALRDAKEAWSNKRVADHCHCSDDLVATVLLRMPKAGGEEPASKLAADGRSFPAEHGKNPKGKAAEEPAKEAEGSSVTKIDPPKSDPASIPVPPQPAAFAAPMPVFDMKRFDAECGVVYREIDTLAGLFGVMQGTRADGVRRLFQEFKSEFVRFHGELTEKGVSK